MKIKIIDLLNMIANDIELNGKIKFFNRIHKEYYYCYLSYENVVENLYVGGIKLNDEVEIIEDKPKEIKKISLDIDKFEDSYYDTALIKIAGVVDKIIDKVNEMSKDD